MKILLIEPDKVLAKTYCQALENIGHQVSVVGQAQDAVLLADKTTPDLVVLELQLAGHNGMEFLYEFRSYPEWQNIPIIIHSFVTLERTGLNKEIVQKLGIYDYLYKPTTSLSTLLATVNTMALARNV